MLTASGFLHLGWTGSFWKQIKRAKKEQEKKGWSRSWTVIMAEIQELHYAADVRSCCCDGCMAHGLQWLKQPTQYLIYLSWALG